MHLEIICLHLILAVVAVVDVIAVIAIVVDDVVDVVVVVVVVVVDVIVCMCRSTNMASFYYRNNISEDDLLSTSSLHQTAAEEASLAEQFQASQVSRRASLK